MKKILQNVIFLNLFLLCNLSYGQNNMEDVVYLKNGSIIRGKIIEQVPNQSIKIQTNDRNVFVFKYDEVEKITKEYLPVDISINNSKETEHKKSGYINLTEINYCPGIGDIKVGSYSVKNKDYSFGLRTINSFQLNEHMSFGIGIGIDKYVYATMLPITFDARATILKGKVSPVFAANIGYAFGFNHAIGGLIINPQIGIKIYILKNVAYLFNIGYKLQAQNVPSNIFYPSINNENYHFITINTGFLF